MGLFSRNSPPTPTPKPVLIETPLLGEWMDDFKSKDTKKLIYKNYNDNDTNELVYLYDETPILRKNLSAIKKYRDEDCYILKGKDFLNIIINQKLELGLLKDMTFPVTKKAKSEFSSMNYTISNYTSEKQSILAKILYDMGFHPNFYRSDRGYSDMQYINNDNKKQIDFFRNLNMMFPCYGNDDIYKSESTENKKYKDRTFVVGRNLQFRSENIDSEKLIEAVLFSYNSYMKRFVIYSRTYWEVDNRPIEKKKLSFDQYKESTKQISELSRSISLLNE